ncbi:MAG: Rrf2 family transcriptional regulator [Pseudomonadota bacterium]
MKRNSRLSLALHSLGHMARAPEERQTSAAIAAHANTNPVVVRRVLGRLRKAGLVASEKGHAGGWRLARAPQDITLADIYLALDERLIAADAEPGATDCSVENALHEKVASLLHDLERTLIDRLSATTLVDLRGQNGSAWRE